jgi:peptidylprolyl isomerase
MKRFILILFVAALPVVWSQNSSTSATSPSGSSTSKTSSGSASPSSAKAASTAAASAKPGTSAVEPWIKLPPGVPRVVHLPLKSPFALRYEDIKIGTGAVGEAGKLWHIKYTGWRAADGVKFDSWDEHSQPLIGKDGKPELGPDGKPKMKDPEPLAVPQGMGRVIPGFDYGLEGMKIGGKRRIFIPYQMAYGTRAIPDRPDHPGIPAKSDLIFDVELVDATDMPAPPMRPGMPGRPMPNGVPPHAGAGGQPGAAPGASGATTAPGAKPATPPPATAPAQPSAQPSTPPPASAPSQPATAPQPQSTTPPPQQ